MADDSPTEQIHEDILERAREARHAWINWAAATAAALAALAAVSGAMSNNYLTTSGRDQIQSNDDWSQYQAKSIKANVLRSKIEILAALNKPEAPSDRKQIDKYESELAQIKENAEQLHESSESHLTRHETIERGVTLFHIGIAVVAIAVLTKRRAFWYGSLFSGALGIVFFALAFVK